MVKLNISQMEKFRLIELVNKKLKSDHFDSDDFILPELQILFEKINNSTNFLELNISEVEILCNWIYDGIIGSQIKKSGDEVLVNKIYEEI